MPYTREQITRLSTAQRFALVRCFSIECVQRGARAKRQIEGIPNVGKIEGVQVRQPTKGSTRIAPKTFEKLSAFGFLREVHPTHTRSCPSHCLLTPEGRDFVVSMLSLVGSDLGQMLKASNYHGRNLDFEQTHQVSWYEDFDTLVAFDLVEMNGLWVEHSKLGETLLQLLNKIRDWAPFIAQAGDPEWTIGQQSPERPKCMTTKVEVLIPLNLDDDGLPEVAIPMRASLQPPGTLTVYAGSVFVCGLAIMDLNDKSGRCRIGELVDAAREQPTEKSPRGRLGVKIDWDGNELWIERIDDPDAVTYFAYADPNGTAT